MRIVNVKYQKTPYMDETTTHVQMFTVDAESSEEARQKIYDHFESLDDPYGVSFSVQSIEFVKHIS